MVFDFKTFFYSCQLLVVHCRWDDLELCGPGFNGLLGKIDHRDTLNLMRRYDRNCFTYGGSKVKAKREAYFTSPPPPVSIPPPPPPLPSPTPLPYSYSHAQIPLLLYITPVRPSPLSPSSFCLSPPFSPLFHSPLLLALLLPTLLLPLHLPYSNPE